MKPQVIFITGASSGFGQISAQMLAEKGHIVYGTSRKSIAHAGHVSMLVVDVTRPDTIHAAIDRIVREQGHIDVVINNAGVGIGGAIELATAEEIEFQMNTNFQGTANVCKAVLPIMRQARSGKIINFSSLGGVMAFRTKGSMPHRNSPSRDTAKRWRWRFIRLASKCA